MFFQKKSNFNWKTPQTKAESLLWFGDSALVWGVFQLKSDFSEKKYFQFSKLVFSSENFELENILDH